MEKAHFLAKKDQAQTEGYWREISRLEGRTWVRGGFVKRLLNIRGVHRNEGRQKAVSLFVV